MSAPPLNRLAGVVVLVVLVVLGGCGDGAMAGDGDAPRAPDTAAPSEAVLTAENVGDGPPPDVPCHEPEFRAIAERLFGGANPYLGAAPRDQLREALEDPGLPPRQRVPMQHQLATRLLQAGEVQAAIDVLEAAHAVVAETGLRQYATPLHALSGLAYLRLAEVENCIRRHNAECCIFPLEGGAVHEERAPALAAREHVEAFLRGTQPGAPDHHTAVWLLNVLAMALGDHPDGVPPEARIDPGAFASEHDVGRFRDIAPQLGVDTLNLCGGVVVEDLDGDGLLDILTSTFDPRGPLRFYRNRGDGTFEDASTRFHSDDQLGGLNMVPADYDNDGDVDVLVLRGAWLFEDGRIRNSLLRNEGGRYLADVTREAGIAEPARPTQAAAWGDFDGDGHLDLYVGNESRVARSPEADYPGQLFRNRGDGTFVDVAAVAGVENDRYCKGVTVGDYDNDGDLDLYLSNHQENRLYRNEGARAFVDVAAEAGVTEPSTRSFACWFFDRDNDGWLDLFVAGYHGTVADLAAEALGRSHSAELPRLYANQRDGTFVDVAESAGLAHVYLPMGANFGDLDNDGWLDVYLTTGQPNFESLMPNVMLRNDGGTRFQDVTTSGGFGHLQKGHGIAFGDLDHDGDQDIYHQLGGFYPGDAFHNALFENPGHGHRWLVVKLVGTTSNRGAVGARLAVVVETAAGRREIHRAVGSVSSFGGSPSRQEIGLGDARRIERVEVRWPNGGETQVFEDVPLDGMIRIVEGEDAFEVVARERFEF